MRTIKEGLEGYLKDVVPDNASYIQIKETRNAFYAGALVTIGLTLKMADIEDIDDAERAYSKLNDEIITFAKERANESTN